MARPKKCRRLSHWQEVLLYKPAGIRRNLLETIVIEADEYEAFKHVVYDRLPQEDAAIRMEVSRPTVTRMYNAALVKIAKALVEGKAIEINSFSNAAIIEKMALE